MKIEEYLLDVINGKETGLIAKIILIILTLLSFLYKVIITLRKLMYSWGIKKQKSLSAKVISVGNITVGGTGKTPVVQLLAKTLTEKGHKVVVLNRGYKANFSDKVGLVSNGTEILMDADQAGDEAYMLASSLTGIPVIIGSERSQTGEFACQEFNPDFIILDDAFQHLQVARDYDLVVIDATNPFGNEHLLPRGLLREPLSSLKRAHVFFLTKVDQIGETRLRDIKKRLIEINPAAMIITTKHNPTYLRRINSNQQNEINLTGEKTLAVSGIGNPKAFEQTLRGLGAELVDKIRFADHHTYTHKEILEIYTLASEKNVDRIITTEKDAVSINDDLLEEIGLEMISFEVLGIEIGIIDSSYKFDELIDRLEVAK
ncbi:lipid-A-disaccharide kinase [Orenia metallireducens]|jgi:tetraacyldisaccharide 4'-kinase|uniref:Tetraacyldisaccharide 4'-kinase n=1 Tax=Orenia metallireducens TaxID=1413210 RepID=A0A285GL48_9FIRM|nr:tetraacyldisaccharide 4'-kinase [Orenia metallireducens]PRX35721.1 lipid-A-disaccharide kinase [Orenia metallireducens]SNY24350.1 lipid-A-disaccharide kinase [Orenia metallireducens]